jgi:hypothetical protein
MPAAGDPYRVAPSRAPHARPPQGRNAAVVVAVVTWCTVVVSRSPIVLLGALALTAPVVARRLD